MYECGGHCRLPRDLVTRDENSPRIRVQFPQLTSEDRGWVLNDSLGIRKRSSRSIKSVVDPSIPDLIIVES